jgi:23S rRNA (adenine2030-N6)-methyltransferase
MFSYRHAFHAGSHSDVFKHLVAQHLLQYLVSKEAPLLVVDTHAGAGFYALQGEHARKSGESATGIAKLWDDLHLPPALARYIGTVRALNLRHHAGDALRFYPGSPLLLLDGMREQDKLRLFELHPTDYRILAANVKQLSEEPQHRRQIQVQQADGFGGLKGFLPPPSRRALVLMDPSYEDKHDYKRVTDTLNDALIRLASGTYAIWYPVLPRPEARGLPARLARLAQTADREWLNVVFAVAKPRRGANGGTVLTESGMFIINPPHTLAGMLKDTMPALVKKLAQDEGAGWRVESSQTTPIAATRKVIKPSWTGTPGPRPEPVVATRKPDAPRKTSAKPVPGKAATGPSYDKIELAADVSADPRFAARVPAKAVRPGTTKKPTR